VKEHIHHLTLILQLLDTHKFFVNESKCVFATTRVSYLGHLLEEGTVAPDPDKIKAIILWPKPTSLTTLHAFLGITGFYRKFIRDYATLASPLTELLKSSMFTWNTNAEEAFTKLKNILTTAPVLSLHNFAIPFVVETDASNIAIGVVLSQEGHPIAFFGKKLCPKMQASSTYVKEMLAITKAVKKWRHYLIGTHFTVITDQQSLKGLLTNACHTQNNKRGLPSCLDTVLTSNTAQAANIKLLISCPGHPNPSFWPYLLRFRTCSRNYKIITRQKGEKKRFTD